MIRPTRPLRPTCRAAERCATACAARGSTRGRSARTCARRPVPSPRARRRRTRAARSEQRPDAADSVSGCPWRSRPPEATRPRFARFLELSPGARARGRRLPRRRPDLPERAAPCARRTHGRVRPSRRHQTAAPRRRDTPSRGRSALWRLSRRRSARASRARRARARAPRAARAAGCTTAPRPSTPSRTRDRCAVPRGRLQSRRRTRSCEAGARRV